ncbi:MAG: ABC transporter permease [Bacilli bacterium]|nr:ABC transporter permease [Bacilli bacterium]
MFIHNFKYSLKTLFRNKMLIFWTFAFPIILGTLFHLAFSNISKSETFDAIDIAIVKNDDFESNEAYKTVFKQLSDESSENHMFNTKYVSEDEAKKLLEDDKIAGYMKLEGDEPKLTFVKNGINQTIFKYVVEEIAQKSNMINNIVEQEIRTEMLSASINEEENTDISIDTQAIIQKAYEQVQNDEVKLKNTSNKNLDYMMIEFYTLIAMTCLYGGILGMVALNQNLANMTNQGKRISVSPIKKAKLLLSSLLAGYVTQLVGLALLFAYTVFVLKVDYGNNIGLIILLAMVGSFTGLTMGVAVASLFKASDNAKTGILIGITMFGCFLAGMMGVTMKYVIDKNVPIINKLNPANMITDGFYSLYYYDTLDRYYFNIASLLIFAFALIVISFFSLRRQKYESI